MLEHEYDLASNAAILMNHKLVVLDGYTLNPGDLSWDDLKNLVSEIEIYDRTPPEMLLKRCVGASIILTNKTSLDAETLQSLPDLRFIGVLSTGYDVVETIAARSQGIVVSNVPAYSTPSVVQMVFGFILHWTNGIAHHSTRVHEGAWVACPDFTFWDFPLHELEGKTLGIIGFGRIGQRVGRVGHALGMKIAAAVRSPKSVEYPTDYISIDQVFTEADFLCLLCPLTTETRGLVNADRLRLMKQSAYLINTSRGAVVIENDLATALNTGTIAGAGLDVLAIEPPQACNPLLNAKNAIITPHNSWATLEARTRLMKETISNVEAFLTGSPRNVVN